MTKLFIVSGTSFSAPGDWPGSGDAECIGGGGGGTIGARSSTWGCAARGGAYSKTTGVTAANGVQLQVGAGGTGVNYTNVNNSTDGGATFFNGTALGSASCSAEGGFRGIPSAAGGIGGRASQGIGGTKYDGGSSGRNGGGGGGAGGPDGAGGWGADGDYGNIAGGGGGGANGGANGVNNGSTVGPGGAGNVGGGNGGNSGINSTPGDNGGAGTTFDASHGPGGGGGGGSSGASTTDSSGGDGGLYGGGGGGANDQTFGGSGNRGGYGAQGLIVITYTASGASLVNRPNSMQPFLVR